jgi:hypothetical protein
MDTQQPRQRRSGETVALHAHVPHSGNAEVCQFCSLARDDRAHVPEAYRDGTEARMSNGQSNGPGYKKDPKTGRFLAGTVAGPGAPIGNHNNSATEVREMFHRIISDRIYAENLLLRARAGMLSPAMEVALYHYTAGKPKETVAFEGGGLGFQIVLVGPRHDPLAEPGRVEGPAEPATLALPPAPPAMP